MESLRWAGAEGRGLMEFSFQFGRGDASGVGMETLTTATPVAIADARAVACKICGGSSPLLGVVDFNKNCAEEKGLRLPLSGCPVYYRQCERCRFVFTTAFDTWDDAAFHQNIYNNGYLAVDPDFVELRPAGNARLVASAFGGARGSICLLDYGGGSGLLAERLRGEGFCAATYDPFSEFNRMPEGQFDLITAFEVMEHVPRPKETVATMVKLLKPGGAIFFSTMVQPQTFASIGLGWWYAGPRNGHVSLHSWGSLACLFAPHGLRVASFSEGLHMAYGAVPAFAGHMGLPG